jgi:hypothetical protein
VANINFISADRLREALEYDPETGEFKRRFCSRTRTNKDGRVGHKSSAGYIQVVFDGVNTRAHQLAWLYFYGEHANGYIDHINGVKWDNRISNLRIATPAINSQNRHPTRQNNKCGATGVTALRDGFRAEIVADQKRYHLGVYETIKEAKAAYNAARLILHKTACF